MKKLVGFLALFILMASSVLATDLEITPDLVSMAATDVKVVDACIQASGGGPLAGADLTVEIYCRDLNSNEICDSGDLSFPEGFSAVVDPTTTPTDADGCGEVTLTTSSATPGTYAYKVNGIDLGTATVIDSEHGLVLVPEFTTIGAGLVLAGAGAYMYRKRKQ